MRNILTVFLVGMSCLIGPTIARADQWQKKMTDFVWTLDNGILEWGRIRDDTCAAIADKKRAAACVIYYDAVISQAKSDRQLLKALLAAVVLSKNEAHAFRTIAKPMFLQFDKNEGVLAKQVLTIFPRAVKTGKK